MKKLNRFISGFLYFYDFAESAKSKSIYDIDSWLEKFGINTFIYNSRTIKYDLIIFHSRVCTIVKCNFAYFFLKTYGLDTSSSPLVDFGFTQKLVHKKKK